MLGHEHVFLVCSGSARAEVEEEDTEEVFTVELHRGPHGLGLALVDGTVGARLPRAAVASLH